MTNKDLQRWLSQFPDNVNVEIDFKLEISEPSTLIEPIPDMVEKEFQNLLLHHIEFDMPVETIRLKLVEE